MTIRFLSPRRAESYGVFGISGGPLMPQGALGAFPERPSDLEGPLGVLKGGQGRAKTPPDMCRAERDSGQTPSVTRLRTARLRSDAGASPGRAQRDSGVTPERHQVAHSATPDRRRASPGCAKRNSEETPERLKVLSMGIDGAEAFP